MNKKIVKALIISGVLVTSIPFNVLATSNYEKVVEGIEEKVSSEMFAIRENGEKIIINKKNSVRTVDAMVIYTDTFGKTTNTNPWGSEVVVDENGKVIGKYMVDLVQEGDVEKGNNVIPKRGYVLSAHGTAQQQLRNIQIGETLKLEGVTLVELNKESTYKLAAVNPNAENNPEGVDNVGVPFPGYRGGDQIVVYDGRDGKKTTETNDYGFELCVQGSLEEGTIVSTGGNNSTIPFDGYVLSGHGEGASFLINEGMIGAKVKVDEETKQIIIKVTPESILGSVKTTVQESEELVLNARKGLYDVPIDKAQGYLEDAKEAFEKAEELVKEMEVDNSATLQYQFLNQIDQIRDSAHQVRYNTMESRSVEGRGIWHRPSEKSLEEVQATLQELKNNHINTLFIETFYQGYTIYPSNNPIAKQHPNFKNQNYGQYGNDLLKAFVEEAKKYNIEIHVWVEDFFVGEKEMGSPILEQKPEWTLYNYDGTDLTKLEGGIYRFMDPSIPEVRQFLIDIYSEMVQKYDIHGLQLDYIRYPVGEYKNDSGYGEYSIATFKEKYNIEQNVDIRDLMDKEKNDEWKLWWDRWNEWKQNNISTFVNEVHDTLKDIEEEVLISTAIFPNISEAMDKKMQNWPLWVQSGWIDLTTPMAYYKDTKTVLSSVESMVNYVDKNALNYAGIAPTFMGLAPHFNADQTRAAQLAQAQGSSIFASQNLLGLEEVSDVLTNSTYRKSAVTPHANIQDVITAACNELKDKARRLYIPNQAMTDKQFSQFENELRIMEKMKITSSKDLNKLSKEIQKLVNKLDHYATGEAKNRISEDLQYLNTIVETREKMMNRK